MGLVFAKQYNKYDDFNTAYIKKLATSTSKLEEDAKKPKDIPVKSLTIKEPPSMPVETVSETRKEALMNECAI